MDASLIEIMGTFFGGIWEGLSSAIVPGTSWSFSGFLIAIFTAGIIGKILKAFFSVFGSHFDSGRQSGKPGSRNYNKKWSDLDNG